MNHSLTPPQQGLYDPRCEHDACGVGFVVDLKGRPSHAILQHALEVLLNLEHRGACGSEKNTGDGAGLLMQTPHAFLRKEAQRLGLSLPGPGSYGTGFVYLPTLDDERAWCEQRIETIIAEEGQEFLGWRTVPVNSSPLGQTALRAMPVIRQVFIGRRVLGDEGPDGLAFERKLYVIRRRIENALACSGLKQRAWFYIPSLSSRTLIYKGMLNSSQITEFYPELLDPTMETGLCLVHSRFSTNTFPNWARSHPYRYLAHNGEINTLRGNVNWMTAREGLFNSDLFGPDIKKILPVIDQGGSDSAMFDNALELLVLSGRSLPHAVMMMIPEPWTGHESMDEEKKAFYEYHSCLMEPWDGPASIAFTDGVRIGAVLDRNGLRPSRYYVTKDDLVIMASEVGVLDVPPERVAYKGRLQPGRMFLVDTEQGRIIADEELKRRIVTEHPYACWLREYLVPIHELPGEPAVESSSEEETPPDHKTVLVQQRAFGYTTEELRILLQPMAAQGNEALGSMGNDASLAVLSDRPQLLYNYFKQLFAQVTNPPVDAIREELIMSVETTIGPEGNLLEPTPQSARQISLPSPLLSNEDLARLKKLDGSGRGGFRSITLPMLFAVQEGTEGLRQAMDTLCARASQAVADGIDVIILSDRDIDREHAGIPALLAVAGVHHHLIREGTRTRVGLVVETGEAREVHHFALLLGYGARAINPYLAFLSLHDLIAQRQLKEIDPARAVKNYIKAGLKGVVKVMSKMGISTAQSYCGAQIFEAIGLGPELIERYFTWTSSRVGGIGLDVLAQEVRSRHERAFPTYESNGLNLDVGGHYQYRKGGEYHLFNPETIHKLQYACRTENYEVFKDYSRLINDRSRGLCTLRGLFEFKSPRPPIPLEEVEPIEAILKRFKTGAMSYGSISKEAHETLAIAMNRIGGKSNTGEGGEDPARYVLDPNGDSRNSAIKQVASGRFGVTSEYLVHARELQIKMAQGAKPGEGGQLPGGKVYPWIARVRHSTPGVGLISPPPHHDIYSIEDLAELIHDLKNANDQARISVKLVAEVGVGTVAAGVAKAHADVVLISGHDGGTGASPLTSIKHAGAPWELGLAETHQTLVLNDLRSRIVVEVDGQLKTGRDVVVGALLGAEEFGFATAPLVAVGCIMMRVCHLNTCPVGVATQNPQLRAKFTGQAEHAVNFMRFVAMEVRELMAQLGFRTLDEMVGHTECLEMSKAVEHYKSRGLDFTPIFHQPDMPAEVGRYCSKLQDHGLENSLDQTTLLPLCQETLKTGKPIKRTLPIRNIHRVVGTILGSEVTRKYGSKGLPEDTITLHFQGSAGQSFAAFIPRGMTFLLEGDSNDYIGKGLSGGKIIVYPPEGSTFVASENVIVGNVAFYGATAGEAYVCGVAGERFCVRNSGVHAVVEGVGDHGCEYMTGGRVVILGPTGRNFAAGMSGGIAYVLDLEGNFANHCNKEMVTLFGLEDSREISLVREMIEKHVLHTRSRRGRTVLDDWNNLVPRFVKVYPNDYRRMVEAIESVKATGVSQDEAEMIAFGINATDASRAGGK
jgi:glutamate synthase (NADPH/NADH) large chain